MNFKAAKRLLKCTLVLCSARRALHDTAKQFNKIRNEQIISNVFNRQTKKLHREFAAQNPEDAKTYDYVKVEVAAQIADRICDISREFPLALDMGCGRGFVSSQLTKEDTVGTMIQGDLSFNSVLNAYPAGLPVNALVFNEEENTVFRENTFDLVTSSLSLHWVNNLPGCFKHVLRTLKPDGCFLGAMFGGDTLFELRCSFQMGEMEREGGMAPHTSPFIQGHELANLLGNAGFNLVTVDMDQIVVNYPDMFELMFDLQGMGENSALHKRKPLHRDTIAAAGSIYEAMYGNKDGSVPATFQILYLIGWKPDKSQPKPLERGSTPKGFHVKQPTL